MTCKIEMVDSVHKVDPGEWIQATKGPISATSGLKP